MYENIVNMRPLSGHVVIRKKPAPTAIGSILVPEAHRKELNDGVVVSVGPGLQMKGGVRKEPDVKPGDHVLFQKWTGFEVKTDDGIFLVIKESEVLGVFQEP